MPKVDTLAPGTTVKETKFTEVVPSSKTPGNEERNFDAFDFQDQMRPEDWEHTTAYLYRVEPPVWRNGDGKTQVTTFINFFSLLDIQREFGGGVWRILIKDTKTRERVADSKHATAGAPRDLTRGDNSLSSSTPVGSVPQSESGGVVSQAMNIVSDPTARAAQTQMLTSAATSAIELVKANAAQQMTVKDILELAEKMNSRPAEKPFLETEVGKIVVAAASALVTALVNRMITPTDPLDQLTKMAGVMQSLGAGGSAASDWKAALVNAAPQLANAVRDTVQELRMGTEAQMRLNAGRTLPAAQMQPQAQAVPAQQNPGQDKVVQMPQPAQQASAPEMIDLKLIELLNDPAMTGDKAGEILDETWPDFVTEVAKLNVDQLIQAFQIRPLLKPHAANPRLREFLTQFLQWANEADAPVAPQPIA